MKKSIPFIIACLLLATSTQKLYSQKNVKSFTVVSYNVENLFDTINDPLTDDDAFTPEGEKKWTPERYTAKLEILARVISEIPSKKLPAIVGMAEVENRDVLVDLVSMKSLKKGKYKIVHEDGEDPRGIDCALIYRPDVFKYGRHSYIPISDPADPEYTYRGILHVEGKAPDGKELHIFMMHWKSRSGGQEETEHQRMLSAIALKKELGMMMVRNPKARIIMMGDFNDEPTNRSITHGLMAGNKRKNIETGEFYNLFYDMHNAEGLGSYNYRGQWNMLDQVIVSYNLLNRSKGLSSGFEDGKIMKEEFMLYDSKKHKQWLPSSTYGGPEYFGGPADHLPVYVTFTIK